MEANKVKQGSMGASRTRSIAFVALTIALLGVSAWVSIPIGPVMLTLQMFAVMFAIMVLTPKQCMASIAGYLALGAIGLPMFSGMRGGIGMLMGPTGGYLWGFLLAAAVALLVREGLRRAIGEKGGFGSDGDRGRHGGLLGVHHRDVRVRMLPVRCCGRHRFGGSFHGDHRALRRARLVEGGGRCAMRSRCASSSAQAVGNIDHQTKRAPSDARFVW